MTKPSFVVCLLLCIQARRDAKKKAAEQELEKQKMLDEVRGEGDGKGRALVCRVIQRLLCWVDSVWVSCFARKFATST